ncbi:uncharacterized protein TrAtP1_008478 [Trichoderma atroviride]|uniref:uncharacterized protein n=1 Tax=Hypocrea atroviridis TaxID=63577 RepID=UPI003327188A|nr:hypothetical protein TrAtP1_008478 [Trichoderma atroviride]
MHAFCGFKVLSVPEAPQKYITAYYCCHYLRCGSMSVCIPSLRLSSCRLPLFFVTSVKTILYNIRRQAHPPRHQMLPSASFRRLLERGLVLRLTSPAARRFLEDSLKVAPGKVLAWPR